MKKTYIAPSEKVKQITIKASLMATSPGGVSTNSTLGNEYTSTDESYAKGSSFGNIWDNEW